MAKKELPAPEDPNAAFCATCPRCGGDHTLIVTSFTCMTQIPLGEDGFSTSDAKFMETSDEMVACRACHASLPLAEVTR